MPARKIINPQEALDHLKSLYQEFEKNNTKNEKFTIDKFKKINKNSDYYIDIYVKKLGGWNHCLNQLKIQPAIKQYHNYDEEKMIRHVKTVYKKFIQQDKNENLLKKIKKSWKISELKKLKIKNPLGKTEDQKKKSFRMVDYIKTNETMQNSISVAVVILRFGSWSKVLEKIHAPIGRTRNLTNEEILNHLKEVFFRFQKKNKKGVFSKEKYQEYNIKNKYNISSKLIERRFGSWKNAKKLIQIN